MSPCATSREIWKRRVILKKPVNDCSSPMPCATDRPNTCQSSLRSRSWPSRSKTVSFDLANLEHVCIFYATQMPVAIQAQVRKQQHEQHQKPQNRIEFIDWPVCKKTKDKDYRMIHVERQCHVSEDRTEFKSRLMVRNVAYQKSVVIRYTVDGWKTFKNVKAVYRSRHDCSYDDFAFTLDLPRHRSGCTLHFAVQYCTAGQEFWDNNDGQNYSIRIAPPPRLATPPSLPLVPTFTTPPLPTSQSPSPWQQRNQPAVQVQAAPFCLSRAVELNSPAYVNLLNTYCFYGATTAPPPMTING